MILSGVWIGGVRKSVRLKRLTLRISRWVLRIKRARSCLNCAEELVTATWVDGEIVPQASPNIASSVSMKSRYWTSSDDGSGRSLAAKKWWPQRATAKIK